LQEVSRGMAWWQWLVFAILLGVALFPWTVIGFMRGRWWWSP
jgi:hypothetical protein